MRNFYDVNSQIIGGDYGQCWVTYQGRMQGQLMYAWHGGQTSPLYAAASTGLVESFDALLQACECMKNDPYYPDDYAKLTEWIKHKQSKAKFEIVANGSSYFVLPWVGRSY